MQSLSYEVLAGLEAEYDESVAATPDIDLFCSSAAWGLSASESLMPARQPWIFRDADAWATLMRFDHPEGWRTLQPLEAMWGLGCPVLARIPEQGAHLVEQVLTSDSMEWDIAMITGVPRGPSLRALGSTLQRRFLLRLGPMAGRYQASLAGGFDGFLARRSRNLRKSLRRAQRRALGTGLVFERLHPKTVDEVAAAHHRILAIEARSWKGISGVGVDRGDMREFYTRMLPRLARRDSVRIIIAKLDDRDIAYVLGGTFAHTYRGLQFSYDHQFAELSLGNLLQVEQVKDLCDEGVEIYDLGMEIDYKRQWGERLVETAMLVVYRR